MSRLVEVTTSVTATRQKAVEEAVTSVATMAWFEDALDRLRADFVLVPECSILDASEKVAVAA